MHFVEHLLGHGGPVDQAPGAVGFRDRECAAGRDFRHRKSHMGQVRNVLEAWIGEIGAGHLGTAFEQVPADRAGGHQVGLGLGPIKFMHQGPQHQGAVGGAPDQHHLGAGGQRVADRHGAKIDIGRRDLAVDERRAVEPGIGAELRVGQRLAQIVPQHHGHARRGQVKFAGQRLHPPGARHRVGGAQIGHDADAMGQGVLQDQFQIAVQKRGVAPLWVARPLELRQCQGTLAQAFVDQIAWPVLLSQVAHHRHRRVIPVPGKARAAADMDALGHVSTGPMNPKSQP